MDKLAVEPRVASPTLWTHLLSGLAACLRQRLIGRPQHGAVTITLPNGKTRTFGDPATGEHAVLRLHNFKVLSQDAARGTVGFAQAYIDGDVEIEDLTALFRYFLQNRDVLDSGESSLVRPRRAGPCLPPLAATTRRRAPRRTFPSTTTSAMTSTASGSTPR